MLREILEKEGHQVWTARDGAEGVACANERRFDVILMDINMPVFDGFAAARQIRDGAGPSDRTPILALTANATPDMQQNMAQAGMNGVLTKPLSREDLKQALQDLPASSRPVTDLLVETGVLAQLHSGLSTDRLQALLRGFEEEATALMADLEQETRSSGLPDRLHALAGLAATVGAAPLSYRSQSGRNRASRPG